jgi:glycosyltransferase involved in cell wall biosynthesis
MQEKKIRAVFWPIGDYLIASTRYRLLDLLPHFSDGIDIRLLEGGKTTPIKAFQALLASKRADCVYIQKKLLPGPYLKLLRLLSPTLIYDFDDALYAQKTGSIPEFEGAEKKMKEKLDTMIRSADIVIAGNETLSTYVERQGTRSVVVPTTYDARNAGVKRHERKEATTIGWIGRAGTLVYLDELVPVLNRLDEIYPGRICLKVISNAPYNPPGLSVPVENVKWSLEDEEEELLTFDIGVMPLRDDEWSRGKCAFKALQMMAHGLPVVVSPVGANSELIIDGVNGFLAGPDTEWVERISGLVEDPALRERLGGEGRATVLQSYSVEGAAKTISTIISTASERSTLIKTGW